MGREFTVYHFEGGEGQLWLCALGVAVLEPSIDEMLKVGPATGDPVTKITSSCNNVNFPPLLD